MKAELPLKPPFLRVFVSSCEIPSLLELTVLPDFDSHEDTKTRKMRHKEERFLAIPPYLSALAAKQVTPSFSWFVVNSMLMRDCGFICAGKHIMRKTS